VEDAVGNVHMRGLSMHLVANEEAALNLLFIGDTNRAVNATAMNPNSSRSHCIFTVHLEARQPGNDVIQRTKLHLVDLAGSERVGKTGASGEVLREAKAINTSLHFLQMCIVALQRRSKRRKRASGSRDTDVDDMHIPYRNCMLTSVLRDSLGGNCMTAMIATINMREKQLGETLSTCRFAQSVAQVRNVAKRNRIIDPRLLLAKRETELAQLREELELMKKGAGDASKPLTAIELRRLKQRVEAYMNAPGDDASVALTMGRITAARVRAGFAIARRMLKTAVEEARAIERGGSGTLRGGGHAILCSRCGGSTDGDSHPGQRGPSAAPGSPSVPGAVSNAVSQAAQASAMSPRRRGARRGAGFGNGAVASRDNDGQASASGSENFNLVKAVVLRAESRENLKAAFEDFRQCHQKWPAVLSNQKLLRGKVAAAKKCGVIVNAARGQIKKLSERLSSVRLKVAAGRLVSPDSSTPDITAEENDLVTEINRCKGAYKKGFEDLKDFKREVTRIKALVERGLKEVQADFHRWYKVSSLSNAARQGAALFAGAVSPSKRNRQPVRQAWGSTQEQDEDIAAFYRAKRELEDFRRRASGK
jgi:kinesin family protein 6/9